MRGRMILQVDVICGYSMRNEKVDAIGNLDWVRWPVCGFSFEVYSWTGIVYCVKSLRFLGVVMFYVEISADDPASHTAIGITFRTTQLLRFDVLVGCRGLPLLYHVARAESDWDTGGLDFLGAMLFGFEVLQRVFDIIWPCLRVLLLGNGYKCKACSHIFRHDCVSLSDLADKCDSRSIEEMGELSSAT